MNPTISTTNSGPADFSRLHRGRPMPIQFHADLASRIYSGLALGLFAYMAMLRDGSEFSIRQMQRTHKEGRDAWSGALAELLELGLVARVRWADGAGQWRTRYYLAQDQPMTVADMDYIRQVHGDRCLIECSPELSNTAIQVSKRVSRRPRKTELAAAAVSDAVVDNSQPASRTGASQLVTPGNAIATAGQPGDAIAATGATRPNATQTSAGGVAAIAGTHKEEEAITYSFPPPYPPHGSDGTSGVPEVNTGGGREEPAHQHPETAVVMASVHRTWPMLSRSDARRIAAVVSQRLVEGHRSDHLRHALTDNPVGVRVPGKLLLHRLDDLGAPAPTSPGLAPWCGGCDHRWIDHGTFVHHCPVCGPAGATSPCLDCQDHLQRHAATHAHTGWCGACDRDERTVRSTDPLTHVSCSAPCPTCHPANTRIRAQVSA